MGMMEDFEASLQVLRGFDADITVEVNEIKVWSWISPIFCSVKDLVNVSVGLCSIMFNCVLQRSVASSTRRTAIRFSQLKQKRYKLPLMVK